MTDSERIRKSVYDIASEAVKDLTRDCLRLRRAVIRTVPNLETGMCGISFAGELNEVKLPYDDSVIGSKVGDSVWVAIPFDNLKSAVVWSKKKIEPSFAYAAAVLGKKIAIRVFFKGVSAGTIGNYLFKADSETVPEHSGTYSFSSGTFIVNDDVGTGYFDILIGAAQMTEPFTVSVVRIDASERTTINIQSGVKYLDICKDMLSKAEESGDTVTESLLRSLLAYAYYYMVWKGLDVSEILEALGGTVPTYSEITATKGPVDVVGTQKTYHYFVNEAKEGIIRSATSDFVKIVDKHGNNNIFASAQGSYNESFDLKVTFFMSITDVEAGGGPDAYKAQYESYSLNIQTVSIDVTYVKNLSTQEYEFTITIGGISVQNIDKEYTIYFMNGETLLFSYTLSFISYMIELITGGYEVIRLKSLYAYHNAVSLYFGKESAVVG